MAKDTLFLTSAKDKKAIRTKGESHKSGSYMDVRFVLRTHTFSQEICDQLRTQTNGRPSGTVRAEVSKVKEQK
jgi:hypothetical protein